jgi:hypothetical protein
MARTPTNILDGLTKILRDNVRLRVARPVGGKPKLGPISIGGGPKITPKADKPKEAPTSPAGGESPSK